MIEKRYFGECNTREIYCYIVTTDDFKVEFSEIGAIIRSVVLKDSQGIERDVVLGFAEIESYFDNWCAAGAVVGRCANRINHARFSLNGETYQLEENVPDGCLHSGRSYHFRIWDSETFEDEMGSHVVFYLNSPHLEQGFPGNLKVKVEYVVKDYSITINYEYESDKDTPVNLTNHSYFNLGGHDRGLAEEQRLMVKADKVTQTDERSMPTGELLDVTGSAFDFRVPTMIKENALKPFQPYYCGQSYDINFVLSKEEGSFEHVATMESDVTGIGMEIYTNMPGLQFYVAGGIKDMKGKGDVFYNGKTSCCLETQFFPDAINIQDFPSPVAKAGECKHTKTIYKFYTKSKDV